MSARPARCAGFTILAALFLLVVLSALGAFMITVGGVQQATPVMSLQGSRAQYAAHAGLEWALHTIDAAAGAVPGWCPGSTAFALAGGALQGFSVNVACDGVEAVTEGSASYNVYSLTVTSTRGSPGSPGFASRTLRATARR